MTITITAQSIQDEVVSRLRIPTPSTTTAYTAVEALGAIDQSVKALAAMRRQKLGEDFDLLTEATLATVADTTTVALPASFGELYRLVWKDTTTHMVELGECPVYELEPAGFNPRPWQVCGIDQPRYRVIGANLHFRPAPDQVYNLTVWGTTVLAIASLASTFVGRLDEQKWVVLDVCERVAVSKKRDAAVFQAERLALEEDLFSADRKIAPQARAVIRDVEGDRYYRRRWDGFPWS